MGRISFALCMIGFGAALAVHCPRAAVREYRCGIAEGRFGRYHRGVNPLSFWTTIIVTFAAGLMGLAFGIFGILFLIMD